MRAIRYLALLAAVQVAAHAAEPRPFAAQHRSWLGGTWDITYNDAVLGEVTGYAELSVQQDPNSEVVGGRITLTDPRTLANFTLEVVSIRVEDGTVAIRAAGRSPPSGAAGSGSGAGSITTLRVPLGAQLEAEAGGAVGSVNVRAARTAELEIRFPLPTGGDVEALEGEWSYTADDAAEMVTGRAGAYDAAQRRVSGVERWVRLPTNVEHAVITEIAAPNGGERTAWLAVIGSDLPVTPGRGLSFAVDDALVRWTGRWRVFDAAPFRAMEFEVAIAPGLHSTPKRFTLNDAEGVWSPDAPATVPMALDYVVEVRGVYEPVPSLFAGQLLQLQARYNGVPVADLIDYRIVASPPGTPARPDERFVTVVLQRSADDPAVYRSGGIQLRTSNDAIAPQAVTSIVVRGGETLAAAYVPVLSSVPDAPDAPKVETSSPVASLPVEAEPELPWPRALETAQSCRASGATVVLSNWMLWEAVEGLDSTLGNLNYLNSPGFALYMDAAEKLGLRQESAYRGLTREIKFDLEDHAAAIVLRDEIRRSLEGFIAAANYTPLANENVPAAQRRQILRDYEASERALVDSLIEAARAGERLPILDAPVPLPDAEVVTGPFWNSGYEYGLIPLSEALVSEDVRREFYLSGRPGWEERLHVYHRSVLAQARGKLLQRAAQALERINAPGECDIVELLRVVGVGTEPVARALLPRLVKPTVRAPGGVLIGPRYEPDVDARIRVMTLRHLAEAVQAQLEYNEYDTDFLVAVASLGVGLGSAPLRAESATARVVRLFGGGSTAAARLALGLSYAVSIGLGAVDIVMAERSVSQFSAAIDEYDYAWGLLAVAGDERLNLAVEERRARFLQLAMVGVMSTGPRITQACACAKLRIPAGLKAWVRARAIQLGEGALNALERVVLQLDAAEVQVRLRSPAESPRVTARDRRITELARRAERSVEDTLRLSSAENRAQPEVVESTYIDFARRRDGRLAPNRPAEESVAPHQFNEAELAEFRLARSVLADAGLGDWAHHLAAFYAGRYRGLSGRQSASLALFERFGGQRALELSGLTSEEFADALLAYGRTATTDATELAVFVAKVMGEQTPRPLLDVANAALNDTRAIRIEAPQSGTPPPAGTPPPRPPAIDPAPAPPSPPPTSAPSSTAPPPAVPRPSPFDGMHPAVRPRVELSAALLREANSALPDHVAAMQVYRAMREVGAANPRVPLTPDEALYAAREAVVAVAAGNVDVDTLALVTAFDFEEIARILERRLLAAAMRQNTRVGPSARPPPDQRAIAQYVVQIMGERAPARYRDAPGAADPSTTVVSAPPAPAEATASSPAVLEARRTMLELDPTMNPGLADVLAQRTMERLRVSPEDAAILVLAGRPNADLDNIALATGRSMDDIAALFERAPRVNGVTDEAAIAAVVVRSMGNRAPQRYRQLVGADEPIARVLGPDTLPAAADETRSFNQTAEIRRGRELLLAMDEDIGVETAQWAIDTTANEFGVTGGHDAAVLALFRRWDRVDLAKLQRLTGLSNDDIAGILEAIPRADGITDQRQIASAVVAHMQGNAPLAVQQLAREADFPVPSYRNERLEIVEPGRAVSREQGPRTVEEWVARQTTLSSVERESLLEQLRLHARMGLDPVPELTQAYVRAAQGQTPREAAALQYILNRGGLADDLVRRAGYSYDEIAGILERYALGGGVTDGAARAKLVARYLESDTPQRLLDLLPEDYRAIIAPGADCSAPSPAPSARSAPPLTAAEEGLLASVRQLARERGLDESVVAAARRDIVGHAVFQRSPADVAVLSAIEAGIPVAQLVQPRGRFTRVEFTDALRRFAASMGGDDAMQAEFAARLLGDGN